MPVDSRGDITDYKQAGQHYRLWFPVDLPLGNGSSDKVGFFYLDGTEERGGYITLLNRIDKISRKA